MCIFDRYNININKKLWKNMNVPKRIQTTSIPSLYSILRVISFSGSIYCITIGISVGFPGKEFYFNQYENSLKK
jgi:hypothetical protein